MANTTEYKIIKIKLDPEIDKDIIDAVYKINDKFERAWYIRWLMREALGLHMNAEGLPIPTPKAPSNQKPAITIKEKIPETEKQPSAEVNKTTESLDRLDNYSKGFFEDSGK